MKKRMLALFLCFALVFSMIPGQAFAQEGDASAEETQPQVTEPEETQPEVTEPEITEPEATEPEETEPETTEPEETEPEATEPEATEPEETEPESTEESTPEDEPAAQANLPGGTCGDNATWTFDEATGVLTISGTGDMYDYEFSPNVAPWPGYSVKKVVIEPGITRIGNYAFVNRYNMTDVSIPDTVISIGWQAFSGCSKLEVVLLPQNLTSIERQAFLNCKSLVRITVPEGVTTIHEQSFSGCTSMQVATLLGNVTSIGNSAFSNCRSMTAINIPASVTSIGDGAFSSCVSLTKLSIPGSVTAIGNDAFIGCTGLTSVSLPDSITSFGYTVFKGCTGLKEVTLPSTFSAVDANTFKDCNALTRVYIPKSYTTVDSLFKSASSLADIYYGGSPADWLNVDRDNLPGTATVFYNCTGLGDPDIPRGSCGSTCSWSFDEATGKLTIEGTYSTYTFTQTPSSAYDREVPWKDYLPQIQSVEVRGVTSIGAYAFADAINLASVSMDSVTYIGDYAFQGCASLKSVSLSASLSSLRAYAFAGSGITQFSVPSQVRYLTGIFQNCTDLKTVFIPSSVQSIDSATFENCTGLTDIYYEGYEGDWSAAFAGTLSDQVTVHYRSSGLDMPGTPEILTGECGYSATWTFDEATGLLTISGSGKIFDFGHLTDSQGIETGERRDTPWKSFLNAIISVRIGDGITYIGNEAFQGAANLVSVYAPTVTSVGKRAFYKAANLATADIPALRSIDAYGFSGCKALTSLPLPDNFSWFKDFAFQGCGFTEFSLPGKVTSLPFLFEGCADLKAVFIPSSVNMIGNTTFWDCTSLTDIYYEGSQEDWAAIYYPIKSPDEYNNATIHYNCTGLGDPGDTDQETISSVHYFLEWNEASSIAAFDNGNVRYLVTEETDAAFSAIAETYLNSYVLIHSKAAPDGSDAAGIILAVERLATMTGTVTAVDSTGITIDGTTYSPLEHLDDPTQFIGEYVVFHVTEYLQLAGLSLLSQEEGYLLAWNADSSWMNISPTPSASNQKAYRFSPSADSDSKALMDTMTSTPNRAILFTVDPLGNVYHVELSGFSSERDAWCFANSPEGFGYGTISHGANYHFPEDRYEEVFGKSYVATATFTNKEVASSMLEKWGGNCYGMSIVACLMYQGLLDLDDYAGNEFTSVNDYYSTLIEEFVFMCNVAYAQSAKSSPITKLIEQYQILQNGAIDYDEIASTYGDLNDYMDLSSMNSDANVLEVFVDNSYSHKPDGTYIGQVLNRIMKSSDPFVVAITGEDDEGNDMAHALVTRTDITPEDMGNGWYRVYVYDPNAPYMPDEYASLSDAPLADYYQNEKTEMRYIELNPNENKWRYQGNSIAGNPNKYYGCNAAGEVEYFHFEDVPFLSGDTDSYVKPDLLYIFSPEKTGMPLSFNGTEPWVSTWDDHAYIFLDESSAIRILLEDGLEICAAAGSAVVSAVEGISFFPRQGDTVDGLNADNGGKLSIPYTDFRVEYISGNDISLVGSDFAFNIASDSPVTLDVSMNEGTVTVTSEDGGEILMQLTHIYSNSEYTSVVADGTLEAGDNVTLTLDENTFTGSLTGSGSLELLTDNHNAPESRPLHNLTEGSGTVEIADVTAAQDTIRVALDETVFTGLDTVYAEGQPCKIIRSETGLYADVPQGTALLVTYTWHIGDETDVHSQYPTGMKVYRIVSNENGYTAEYIPELDNLLQYSGSSIRITGNKGIRMITSITKGNKSALTEEGLAGFTLEEYGTALCWATDLAPGEDLVLGKDYTRSNYAYKKGVADPIFAQTPELIQYTNVLVGFDDDQCIPDIAMRPYIILSDAEGNQVTLYGGTVYRSIGYIAWQNRTVFQPGSASYDYVWGIIHHVYGDQFDADYQG